LALLLKLGGKNTTENAKKCLGGANESVKMSKKNPLRKLSGFFKKV
jgi:hypothetical protein